MVDPRQRPRTGGRVWLDDLRHEPGGAILYAAVLYLPESEHVADVTVAADGTVAFGAWSPPDPPAWLLDYARQFLRGEWRARQVPDPPPWPERITRWRG